MSTRMFVYKSQIPYLPVDMTFERNPLFAEDQAVMCLSAPALLTGGLDVPRFLRPGRVRMGQTPWLNLRTYPWRKPE